VIGLADRVVHVAGITTRPHEAWMLQVGRNLLDDAEGVLRGKRYLIIDRDSKYSLRFREFVQEGGTEVIRLPPLSPNLNAFAERFVRSIKDECLGRMIFFGQGSLRRAITDYLAHYHEERNHQGLENRLIRRKPANAANDAAISRRTRLGGTLSYSIALRHEPVVRESGQYGTQPATAIRRNVTSGGTEDMPEVYRSCRSNFWTPRVCQQPLARIPCRKATAYIVGFLGQDGPASP
jgi:transposase InsO family protein